MLSENIFLLHCGVTWMMIGVIWVVQIVGYPLFAFAGEGFFKTYHREHVKRISFVVGPLMLIEVATAIYLMKFPPMGMPYQMFLVTVALLLGVWLSTLIFSIPAHHRLKQGFETPAHRFLVVSNTVRVVLWGARGVLLLLILKRMWLQ